MKKVVLIALIPCLSVQAEEVVSSNGVSFYAGASMVSSWTSSDFKMDYTVDNFFDIKNPGSNHKKNSIGRVGVEFAAGVKKKFSNDWFVGSELNYTLSRATHDHDFNEIEAGETPEDTADTDRISFIQIKHGDEIGISFKFGKEFKCYEVYGILGATTKQVKIKYGLDGTNALITGNAFEINPKKRVWGAVFGLGGSKKITDKISCSLEYKYKLYNSAKKSIDCRGASSDAFGADHDTSDRNFKVKSDKHELSLGVTFNI